MGAVHHCAVDMPRTEITSAWQRLGVRVARDQARYETFAGVTKGVSALPMPTQVLRLADAVADKCGLLDRPFSIDALIRVARRVAGAEDFGDVDLTGPLRRFLGACADEARLSLGGRFATRWDVVRFLVNLLELRA